MTKNIKTCNARRWRSFVGALAIICAASLVALAQTSSGGTVISNTATSTYSDGTDTYATTSNTVSVTVSNVAGLTITPDAGTNPTVVLDQTLVNFVFTVTNTGNFTNQVSFANAGASIIKTGSAAATVTRAVIDLDNSGTVTGGDTNILTNSGVVTSANLLRDTNLKVVVEVTVGSAALPGQTINIQLGDAAAGTPWDNEALVASAGDVVTATTGVNGLKEARGDISATVEKDALIRLTLTAPSGPVAIGADITYGWVLTNDGQRVANSQTLSGNSGLFIVVPIPGRTKLKNTTGFPVGTLYTADAITTAPLAASWSTTAPALNTVTRVALNTGATLAAAASTTSINVVVTVQTGISIVAPIGEIGDTFMVNSVGAAKTDQSGDSDANYGDGNADFTEANGIGSVDGNGVVQYTTLSSTGGSVLLGPLGFQGAVGPTDTNDDYTNRGVNTGITGVAPGGNTTALGVVTFSNTVQNTGDADDTFTFTAPTVPTGFTVQVSVNGLGTDYVNAATSPTLAVAFGATATILVKVTEPSGNVVLTGYPTVVLATSLNTVTATNATIDRLYTGYLQLTKSQTVANATGIGTATDPVPGATIAYVIAYDNVTSSGGTNNSNINASGIVLLDPVPANTDFKVGSATSNPSAGITVVTAYSNDNGSTWTYTPTSLAGSAPAGFDRTVTHVRFTLTGPMTPAAAAGNNGFTVGIR